MISLLRVKTASQGKALKISQDLFIAILAATGPSVPAMSETAQGIFCANNKRDQIFKSFQNLKAISTATQQNRLLNFNDV